MKAKYVVNFAKPYSTAERIGLMHLLNSAFLASKVAACSGNGANNQGRTGYAASP